ncbi:hypothetical protein DAPPUDRAFT_326203 [Daphnia pulex]|uniref:XRN2-binding (XTBD) domain-containing protein n=1 Tax=Daphnia pulex TaxID=6669 RepID=E9H6V2_DAPPU|nr:hypothetical protein DAPPUDRAFT_326203 [Daphnia pulex]|eukprot:EFX72464.1 hypothetical protein DAPPUDRAFT_326203 [Daphnia pulex]
MNRNQRQPPIGNSRKLFEPEDQWRLRKSFMEKMQGKMLSNKSLLTLADKLVNVEFLGQEYPVHVLKKVIKSAGGTLIQFRRKENLQC